MEIAWQKKGLRNVLYAACIAGCGSALVGTAYLIPNGSGGIGFDDLRYSQSLHRVLVPGGRAGVLALIEPETGKMTTITGFSTQRSYDGGHDFGVTSVDAGRGLVFASDRTTRSVKVIDPSAQTIVGSFKLGAEPDYVRFVEPTSELWISEPSAEQLEIVSVSDASPPELARVATIHVDNGPESLVIDTARERAYTHRWQASTLAIDVHTREIAAEWKNGCAASRGIDVEPEHGFVLAACSEGTLSVIDAAHGGAIVSSLAEGSGYDVIGYNAHLRHVYLAGGACSCVTTLALSPTGQLTWLGRAEAPNDTHCVVADDIGSAWVCEPSEGRVRKISDPYPGSR